MADVDAAAHVLRQGGTHRSRDGTADIAGIADIEKHADWYRSVRAAHTTGTEGNVDGILRDEIGKVFLEVLTHAGVFKRDAAGMAAFDRWIESIAGV